MKVNLNLPEKMKFLFQPSRYKVCYGGRGSGKSWSMARVLIVKALEKKITILCCREVMKSLKESSHKLISEQIEMMGLDKYFDITAQEIRCIKTGSKFLFAGLATNTVESIKSFEGINYCWIDEAQPISKHSLDILIPTIRAPYSEIWFSFNPYFEDDPVYKQFVLKANEVQSCITVKVNWDDNPYFNNVMVEEKDRMMKYDYEKYLHTYEGECKKSGKAAIFSGKFTSYDFSSKIDPDMWSPFYGVDFGFASDPSVMIKSWVFERTLYIEHEVYAYQAEIDMLPALFFQIPGANKHISRADCSRPELIKMMKRDGFPRMIECKKWPGSIEDGIDFMRSFDEIVIHPRCKNVLDEFKLYSYKEDKLSGDILPDIIDKNNHGMDAIRYSLQPLIQGYKNKIQARADAVKLNDMGMPETNYRHGQDSIHSWLM